MSKYIEHEVDWFLTDAITTKYSGIKSAIHITINDGFGNEPYVLYANNPHWISPYEEMTVVSFNGEILKGKTFDELELLKKWIEKNKQTLLDYWNAELDSVTMSRKILSI